MLRKEKDSELSKEELALLPKDIAQWGLLDKENGAKTQLLAHTVCKESVWSDENLEVERPDAEEGKRYQMQGGTNSNIQIYIPKVLRMDILDEAHSSPFGGHLGREKIYSILQRRVYWPGMSKQVAEFTKNCIICRKSKYSSQVNVTPMMNIYAKHPFYRVGCDVLGPLPRTINGNKYIIIFTCYFTKYPVAYCTSDHKKETLIRCLIKFCMNFGTPFELHMDRGPEMVSRAMTQAAQALNILRVFSTAYHHQCLGVSERFNKTLGNALRCFITKNRQKEWDEYIDPIMMAYRNSVHRTTGQTPQFMVFGHDMVMPLDCLLRTYVWDIKKANTYVVNKINRLSEAWEFASRKMYSAQKTQKKYYDRRISGKCTEFEKGDLVLLRTGFIPKGKSKKLTELYQGLFRITEMEFPNAEITPFGSHRSKTQLVNIKRLQLYKQCGIPDLRKDEEDEEVFICPECDKKFGDDDKPWVECDKCTLWYHIDCTLLEDAPNDKEVWYCAQCRYYHPWIGEFMTAIENKKEVSPCPVLPIAKKNKFRNPLNANIPIRSYDLDEQEEDTQSTRSAEFSLNMDEQQNGNKEVEKGRYGSMGRCKFGEQHRWRFTNGGFFAQKLIRKLRF